MLELIGYAASLIIAISLMMSSLLRLRLINLLGSVLFVAYGIGIGALPVAVVNAFIVLVNLYYLARMLRTREYFRILRVAPESEYVRYFLERNAGEIRRYVPGFDFAPAGDALAFFVLRDVVPAGLFIAEPAGESTLRVRLDYVLPGYRDLKVARYLFHQSGVFGELGIRRLLSEPGNPTHARYLRRMGFEPADGGLLETRIG